MKYCKDCGHVGYTKQHTSGSIAVELALWMLLILPGVLYSVWRLTTRRDVCGLCGSTCVIPNSSPEALRLRMGRELQK
jgi:hypothetical protein